MKGNYRLQNVFFTPLLMNATNIGHLLFTINKNQLDIPSPKSLFGKKNALESGTCRHEPCAGTAGAKMERVILEEDRK